ncbi:MlaD family protein [Psychromarinibacter sp. C21-152]|uniref:MlaD family protein n=1 Tax=Psychromarinibacter sediminicola TaxID=3033385 RepID=A0AAE3NSQ0_9RHOB|nr:MlaD family protein [Psychromarinibacter sediminicola]MDF0600240.1 MlaD family protein [Psychromarinibacter sediminicola]
MSDPTPAEPHVRRGAGGILFRLSFVWLVPVLALAISLGVAWQSYSERGVLIEIAFESASGIAADRTELKYRDVSVGTVEDVSFSEDLGEVVVAVRVDRTLAPYLDSDAEFWVVQPEVSVRGISGLNTVLSGVYIEGSWDNDPGEPMTRFTGLPRPPLASPTRAGTALVLRARDGNSIAAGAPILYKGIPVGAIEAPQLAEDGDGVSINAFVEAPYDRLLTSNTRFWDISGVSVSLGAGGVSLDFSSLASLVEGGISFDTMVSGGDPVERGQSFQLYADQPAARASLLTDRSAERLRVLAVFDGSVSGLSQGTTVRFQGVPVGEVTEIAMVAEDIDGRKVVRLNATLALAPDRLGLGEDASTQEALALLDDYVAQGLRARLASASLLSSQLVVELAEFPDSDPAWIVNEEGRLPELPTAESDLADLNATAQGVFERINALPIEELLASAQTLLVSANEVVSAEETRAVIPELTGTLAEARTLIPELAATLDEARATLTEARQIAAELREGGATAAVNGALDSAANAANAVETAAGALPPIVARLDTLASRTEAVLNAYSDNSRLINSALTTLRDISEAADALRGLARTLQRNPNSLLMGR